MRALISRLTVFTITAGILVTVSGCGTSGSPVEPDQAPAMGIYATANT